MNLSYLARLICLSLAAFFLVNAACGLAAGLMARWAVGWVRRLAPASGARLLLGLRLFPAGFAMFVVAGLCTPSYLWLEPKEASEEIGVVCLLAALLGLAVWGHSLTRSARAVARSARHLRDCRGRSREMHVPGERTAAWVIDGPPCVMLAGVLRQRLVISRDVVAALTPEQLSAAIRHERAHGSSYDNLKRLLMMLAPGILPLWRGFRTLEREWAKLTEWAADDRAAAGKQRRSLSLASALVRVARLGSTLAAPPLATSLMAEGEDLAERVDRLLRPAQRARRHRREPVLAASAALLVTGAVAAVVAHPVTLHSAHEVLEFLIQ